MTLSNRERACTKNPQPERLREELAKANLRIKDIQEELEESNRGMLALSMELENLVAERTRELREVNLELTESIRELEQSRAEVESQALFPKQNPNPVMRVSPDGMIMYANQGSEPFLARLKSGGRQAIPEQWLNCVREAIQSDRHLHRDLEIAGRYFSVTFTPIEGEGYINIYAQDITARKTAERSLQWELEVNTTLAQLAQDLIGQAGDIDTIAGTVLEYAKEITNSRHGMVSSVDRQTGQNVFHTFTAMMGQSCRVGEKDFRIAFDCNQDGTYPGLWGHCLNSREAFFTNEPESHPRAKGLPSGHVPIHSFLTVPVLIGDHLLGQVAVANPRYKYDEQDMQALQQLAGIYALSLQRCKEEEKRLEIEKTYRHVQKMEAVGTLAGGISHDFNNILAAMMGYVNLSLHDLPANSHVRHNLKQVLKAGERARNLIKQILAFSRRVDQESAPMNIAPVAKEVLKLMKATLPSYIEIRQDVDNDPGNVLADPGAIHQVLMNLCSNASHAMRQNGGVLSVWVKTLCAKSQALPAELITRDEDFVFFGVADTGTGIEQNTLDRIFEPYFTTKESNEGTGLGLAVVHGIIEGLGGFISVESEQGRGTAISIYLPICEMPESKADENPAYAMGAGERILFVDDEKALVEIASRNLSRMGYRAACYAHPESALEAFQRDPSSFDIVITDLTMPKITGDRLAAEIKTIRPEVPVIICTGYSEHACGESAKRLGVEAVLLKPLDDSKLSSTLRYLLEG